jgi:hypothetical protein
MKMNNVYNLQETLTFLAKVMKGAGELKRGGGVCSCQNFSYHATNAELLDFYILLIHSSHEKRNTPSSG